MERRTEILRKSLGLNYEAFRQGGIAFDYEGLMNATGYDLEEVRRVQRSVGVGGTPLLELRRITELARKVSPTGRAARIFIKDEAANPSGSFKDRRASLSVHQARKLGYPGVIAATSGNYGAAVASQAAMQRL